MMNTAYPQFGENSLNGLVKRRDQQQQRETPVRGVVQDSPAQHTAPPGTPHAAPPKKPNRTARKYPKTIRIQEESFPTKKVRLDLWVEPLVKAEVLRVAKASGLNQSKTGNALLKRILQHNLYEQHEALLHPIIKQAIHDEMATLLKRLSFLLVRVTYASEQTRSLVTNLLNYQTTMTPEKLTAILNGTSKAAKMKIIENTPQIQSLMNELEQIFVNDMKKE